MPAQWLSNSSDIGARVGERLEAAVVYLSQPSRVRLLRRLLLALLALWVVGSLARLIWALYPAAEPEVEPDVAVINPIAGNPAQLARAPVDVGALRGRHLFGDAGAAAAVEAQPEVKPDTSREGIENGARETRLQLVLRGVLSSDRAGLGQAIIEYQNRQDVYAVEDKLPVPGNVVLAKVMPQQVVLDNNGTYELLSLFEENALEARATRSPVVPSAHSAPAQRPAATLVDKRGDASATKLASGYRDRLYANPQSLAEVVTVSAVRRDGELLGYRVAPGKDARQFATLGFKPGDLVTSVNGIALNDPANTMRLYQTMRTASEAVFDLQRGEDNLSISVSLGQAGETR